MAPSEQAWVPPSRLPGIPSGNPDVSPASFTPPRRYGKYQDESATRQRWLEDPSDETCPFESSDLTLDYLRETGWAVSTDKIKAHRDVAQNALSLGYPDGDAYTQAFITKIEEGRRVGEQNIYDISVGEGIMFIAEVCRSDGPYVRRATT